MDIRHEEGFPEALNETRNQTPPSQAPRGAWPEDSLARVPYWVYQDEANYEREMRRLFEGATWNFVCLEADIPNKGDYRTNQVGALPVIVVRGPDGQINCFENRCSHRGALIAFDDGGNVQNNFKCVYHAWSYDLSGNLRGIAFERGINGPDGKMRGGMPAWTNVARPMSKRHASERERNISWSSEKRKLSWSRGSAPSRRGA